MDSDLNYNERKEWAKTLYTKLDRSLRETALEVGVDEADVRMWAIADRWNDIRTSLLISKKTQLERYYVALDMLETKRKTDDSFTIKDIDLCIKYTAAIKNLEEETSLPYVVQVAENFTTWLLHRDIGLAHRVAAEFTAFIDQLPE